MQLFSSEFLPSFSFLCPWDPVLTGLSSTIHELKAPGTEMGHEKFLWLYGGAIKEMVGIFPAASGSSRRGWFCYRSSGAVF